MKSILIFIIIVNLWAWNQETSYGGRPLVRVYQDCHYRGDVVSLPPGSYNTYDLEKLGMRNDKISSLKVPRGLTVSLYEHENFKSLLKTVNTDIDCFTGKYAYLNDCVSSIEVRYTGN